MVDSVVSNGSSISRTVQLRSSVLTFASCTSVSLSLSVCVWRWYSYIYRFIVVIEE